MPLNRFYLTEAGWVPEGPLTRETTPWCDRIVQDVLESAWQILDEAARPPLVLLAWSDPEALSARLGA